nr:methionine--tRNA ligase subunit beta [Candidatus Njordarchaeum guaymaensis]
MSFSEEPNGQSRKSTKAGQISLDDFEKLDLRIGEVVSASAVPGSEKLMKLEIDLGTHHRVVLSGMRPDYSPGEVVGKQVVVLCNLEPRKIMGIVSQGMILDAGYRDGIRPPALLTVSHRVPNGVRIA